MRRIKNHLKNLKDLKEKDNVVLMTEYKTLLQKRKFYDSRDWKQLREEVKKRDNYECQECKRQGLVFLNTDELNKSGKRKKIKLVVHHIKELEDHPDLALEIDNLETVCVNCHNKIHGRVNEFIHKENKWAHDEKW
jgi:5-methylcytosine-specific restriction enzyme A